MDIRPSAIARTKKFEGSKNHFYRDTKLNVTVGVGHLLATSTSAAGMNMLRNSDDKPATKKEKIDEWTGVFNGTIGTGQSTLYMERGEIDSVLSADLAQAAADLAKRFSDLDTYPEDAQDALLDMMFNLGLTQFSKVNWPDLFKAVESDDWTTAAKESHRSDVQATRNDEIKQLFLNAASAVVVVVPLQQMGLAASGIVDNLASVMRTAATEMKANPKLFPAGINHIVVDVHVGAFSLKVELQGPEKAADLIATTRPTANRRRARKRRVSAKAASKR